MIRIRNTGHCTVKCRICVIVTYSAGDWVPAKGGIIAVEPIRDLPGADHRSHGVAVPQRLPNGYYIRHNLRKRKKSEANECSHICAVLRQPIM